MRRAGFSLVELMVVLVLVGTLVSLALPRFNTFIARGRQAEAHANLGIIATLQQSYKLEYEYKNDSKFHDGLFMGMGHPRNWCKDTDTSKQNSLGFRVADCEELRYTYETNHILDDSATSSASIKNPPRFGRSGFQSAPRYIYPNCRESEYWVVSKDRKLKLGSPTDVIEKCT